MITKSGWSAQTTAWQAWCRVAVPAGSGKIRIDANSLKNQLLAIDACIILKPSAVTATASKPRESSDVPSILKTINFSTLYRSAELRRSGIKKPPGSPHTTRGWFNFGHSETWSKSEFNSFNDAPSSFTMTDVGKTTKGACPACPQMIITNGQQQSSLCCNIFITIYW